MIFLVFFCKFACFFNENSLILDELSEFVTQNL